jgi:hypothetical protein
MPPKGGGKKMVAFQQEVQRTAARWGEGIVTSKGKGATPFPITVERTFERPKGAAEPYDVDTLSVKLIIKNLRIEDRPVSVKITTDLPQQLANCMSEAIQAQWMEALRHSPGQGWLLEKLFGWVEMRFASLLQMVPECLEVLLTIFSHHSFVVIVY